MPRRYWAGTNLNWRGFMKATYYGHSCFAINVAGKALLFDPFITGNELAKGINAAQIRADYLLISHAHWDHLADAGDIAKRTGATIVSNYEIVQYFGKQGLEKGHPLNHGGAHRFEFGRVKFVNAIHSSSLPDGAYGGNPGDSWSRARRGTSTTPGTRP